MSEQRKTAEDRDILAAIVDSSEDAILSKTLDGTITSWNKGAERIYGYTPGEVIGKNISILVPPDHSDEIPKILECVKNGELVRHYETVRRRRDGSIIDVSLTVSPVRNLDGDIIGASTVARDISEEKRIKAERQFLALIVENSDDAIYSKSLEGVILSWNKGSEKIYGYTADEVIGKPISILIPPGNENEVPQILQRLKKGERIEHYDTVRLRKDGTMIHVSMTISPIRDDAGKIIAASSIAKDISEKKRAEAIIQAQLEEKKVLLQEIYHRAKNNLQLVSSLLELRARQVKDVESRTALKDSVGRIQAMALVHEKMYRSESLGTVDFRDYVKTLFEPVVQSYPSQEHRINFSFQSDPCFVDLDMAVSLGLILNELLTNSLKHALTPSKTLEMRIDIKVNEDRMRLTVSDTGPGLPKNIDFLSSNTFGFRIVKLLIDQINANIEIQSGNGTIFKISVPLKKVKEFENK